MTTNTTPKQRRGKAAAASETPAPPKKRTATKRSASTPKAPAAAKKAPANAKKTASAAPAARKRAATAKKPTVSKASILDGSLVPEGTPRTVGAGFLTTHADNYAWIPDKSVDLFLSDPPFNIAQDTNFHTWDKNTINSYRFDEGKDWDTYDQHEFIKLMRSWAEEINRVLRPGGSFAIFCADKYLSHFNDALESTGLSVRRTLTWRKPNAVPINRKAMMMSACEYVLIGVKGAKATFNADLPCDNPDGFADIEQVLVADKASVIVEKAVRDALARVSVTGDTRPDAVQRAVAEAIAQASTAAAAKVREMYTDEGGNGAYLRGCVPNEVRFTSKGGNRLHPTEKPVPLLRYLAALLSQPGDVILDSFGGSGSTGEAALSVGRQVIIVERDQEFYDALTNRLVAFADGLDRKSQSLF